MNNIDSILRRLRLVLAAVAALGLLVLPSVASAKRHDRTRDRNHDGIPDKWEKRFSISTKKHGMGKADPDKDGLTNKAEWRSGTNPKLADTNGNGVPDASEDPDGDKVDNANEAREHTDPRKADSNGNGVKDGSEDADHDKLNNAGEQEAGTDPMNPDTDGDGVKDGDEDAGQVTAWDGTTLTIRVFGGSTISGTVDQDTFIDCGLDNSSSDTTGLDPSMGGDSTGDTGAVDDGSGNDPLAKRHARVAADGSTDSTDPTIDDGSTDPTIDDGSTDPTIDDGTTDPTTDGSGDTSTGAGTDACTAALKVGAVVTEASFSVTADGTFFDAIELK